MRAITVLGLGAALLLTASVGSCSQKQAMPQQIPAIEVQTVDTTSEDLNTYYPAIIRGKTDIAIRPQVSGFITKVHVDEGQHVRKGQVLFTIDQVQYQATVEQAHAAVNSAQAAVNTAASNERNQKMLFEKNIISQTQWQTAADGTCRSGSGSSRTRVRQEKPLIHHRHCPLGRRCRFHTATRRLAGLALIGTAADHHQRQLASVRILLAKRKRTAQTHRQRRIQP